MKTSRSRTKSPSSGSRPRNLRCAGLAFLRSLVLAPLLVVGGLILEVLLVGVLHLHHYEFLLLGVFLIGSGVMLLVRAFRNRGLRVLVFPEGLVRLHRGRALAFWWEEIGQVWQKTNAGYHGIGRAWRGALSLALQAADGRQMSFDDSLPRLAQLIRIVCRETLPFLWPQVQADYEAGKTLAYGKLRVSQRGLSHGKESLPWSEVQSAKLDGSHLFVYRKGKWVHSLSFTVSDIPNFHVLLALIEQRVPVEKSSK